MYSHAEIPVPRNQPIGLTPASPNILGKITNYHAKDTHIGKDPDTGKD